MSPVRLWWALLQPQFLPSNALVLFSVRLLPSTVLSSSTDFQAVCAIQSGFCLRFHLLATLVANGYCQLHLPSFKGLPAYTLTVAGYSLHRLCDKFAFCSSALICPIPGTNQLHFAIPFVHDLTSLAGLWSVWPHLISPGLLGSIISWQNAPKLPVSAISVS